MGARHGNNQADDEDEVSLVGIGGEEEDGVQSRLQYPQADQA